MEAEICSSEFYYNEGVTKYEEGEYTLSIENFKKAIELNSSEFDYYYNLGVTYLKIEEYDLAIETFNKAIPINSKDTDLYMNLGMAFYSKGDFQKAAKAYSKAVFINSGDPENCNYAGIAHCAVKNFKEAIYYFKQAVKLEPRNITFGYNLAQAYFELEKYGQAEECLVNISRFSKKNDEMYVLAGKIYLKQYDYNLAKDSFENALKINPEHKEAQSLFDQIIEREERRAKIKSGKKEENKPDMKAEIKNCFKSATKFMEQEDYQTAGIELEKIILMIKKLPEAATRFKM